MKNYEHPLATTDGWETHHRSPAECLLARLWFRGFHVFLRGQPAQLIVRPLPAHWWPVMDVEPVLTKEEQETIRCHADEIARVALREEEVNMSELNG